MDVYGLFLNSRTNDNAVGRTQMIILDRKRVASQQILYTRTISSSVPLVAVCPKPQHHLMIARELQMQAGSAGLSRTTERIDL